MLRHWLDRAEAEGWTRDEFRLALKERERETPRTEEGRTPRLENATPRSPAGIREEAQNGGGCQLVLELEPERELAWTTAAETTGLDLRAWIPPSRGRGGFSLTLTRGTHRGTHAVRIPGTSGTPDPRLQAVSCSPCGENGPARIRTWVPRIMSPLL